MLDRSEIDARLGRINQAVLRERETFRPIVDGQTIKIDGNMRLTDAENAVAMKLAEAWNLFATLPVEHGDDTDEFRRAIHAAQAKVLMRPGRRQLNR